MKPAWVLLWKYYRRAFYFNPLLRKEFHKREKIYTHITGEKLPIHILDGCLEMSKMAKNVKK